MGKGDKKSGKGKRFMGSHGKTRPRKKKSGGSAPAKAPAKKSKKSA